MVDVHVLRVFTDAGGRFGNPLGVILDTRALSTEERQAIARRLNYSETVFVDDVAIAGLRIYTPAAELPLAGHPLVGASWLLSRLNGTPIPTLRPALASEVDTWVEDGVTWIRARVANAPDWSFVELETAAQIEALSVPPGLEYDMHAFYAWEDREAGRMRARVFASLHDIPEDEATGSAALRLTNRLGRALTIRQGRGSIVHARPASAAGYAEVGGLVVEDAMRRL